ncbi:hypothetical protein [Actinoplanes sp. NBC_00393]|uniref:hypothetical protein n=1 Tax=Actinoplanes sp. NBC_00393 TaxID=2975953 RepID=UPI003FA4D48B
MFTGAAPTATADVWSLGVLLVEMVTREPARHAGRVARAVERGGPRLPGGRSPPSPASPAGSRLPAAADRRRHTTPRRTLARRCGLSRHCGGGAAAARRRRGWRGRSVISRCRRCGRGWHGRRGGGQRGRGRRRATS